MLLFLHLDWLYLHHHLPASFAHTISSPFGTTLSSPSPLTYTCRASTEREGTNAFTIASSTSSLIGSGGCGGWSLWLLAEAVTAVVAASARRGGEGWRHTSSEGDSRCALTE